MSAVDGVPVVEHVRAHLAHLAHCRARLVLVRDAIGRAPNGKVDYRGLTTWACAQADAPR